MPHDRPLTPEDERIATAVRECLAGSGGDLMLSHLFDVFHMFTSTHVAGDPTETAFREGQRSVILYLSALADGTPTRSVTSERRRWIERHFPQKDTKE